MAPRTPLVHPRAYFEDRGFPLRPAAAAVGAAVLALAVALVGFGVLFTSRLEAAGHPEATSAVWRAVTSQLLVTVFVGFLFGWFLVAVLLHFLTRAFVGHDGTFGKTLAVAGWGTATSVVGSLVAFAVLAVALQDASMASPETFAAEFRANLGASGFLQNAVGLLLATWQTYIYANGLEVEFDDTSGTPWLVAGTVAYGAWLLSVF